MSKQSSVVWLWHNLTDDLIGDLSNQKIHKIYNLVLEAEQMHKEEIVEAYKYGNLSDVYFKPEQYYQETYGGNNE